mmetsp:Transcript_13774/g.24481  ORF Transcript_13774/g.24481 Transcript_13774/m.24481 type:complete len:584 (+) Transcript_13774:409-2160(+)
MAQLKEQICNLQKQVRDFTKDEVYDSAELLGSFLVNLSGKVASSTEQGKLPIIGDGSHIECLIVYADALKGKGETQRAIEYYKQALSHRKSLRINPGSSKFTPRSSSNEGKSRETMDNEDEVQGASAADFGHLEAEIKFSIARCQAKLKQKQAALKTLESINSRYRSSSMLYWMGKLYQKCGMERPAVNGYREQLRSSPYALSTILSLLRLGAGASEIAHICASQLLENDVGWVANFVEAHGYYSLSQHGAALNSFAKLNKKFPNHVHVLTSMGELNIEMNDKNAAVLLFQKARAADMKSLDGMDSYASLIRQQQDLGRLNSITRELVDIDETRPEPWIAVALFYELRGDTMSALQFVCKALELDPYHVPAYHFKGALQLRMNQPELSVSAYYKAYSIRRDFSAYKGLVNAYLAIPKVSEALRTAKEALQLMPKDARAILLVGRVLAQTPGDGRKKASKAYAKALKLDPMCYEAALAFADLYLLQHQASPNSDLQPAIQVLSHTLQHQSKDFLHSKLGELFTAAADYGSALTEFHNALSINPEFQLAKMGIERLEKLMRGIDPDADDDGDYDLENEEYGEQDI